MSDNSKKKVRKPKVKAKVKLSLIEEDEDPQLILDKDYNELTTNPLKTDVEIKEFENKKEELEAKNILSNKEFEYLYPNLNDPNFNIKISERKEFYDTKYDGEIKNVSEEGEKLCNAEFELSPHQIFVRNFLSFQTPYNSVLLYHGLGTGKTCSAITVAEEMRDYIKQVGVSHKILVVASPNVQENFKLQLFDENKLKLIDGVWNIKS